MRIQFVGFFHDGPACSFGDVASEAEAFTSRADAERKLSERVNSGGSERCDSDYPVCHDDMVATHVWEERVELVLASESAYIDLYRVIPDGPKGWGYVASEPEYRVTVGPRGGVHAESF